MTDLTPEDAVIARDRSLGVRVHLETLISRANAEGTPAMRARLFQQTLAELDEATKAIQTARRGAVAELREAGSSYDQIASVLGVSRSRAQQLVKE